MSRHWTCEHCGRGGLPIEVVECPGCKKRRDVSMFPTVEHSDTDHWECPECGKVNFSADPYCTGCGRQRSGYIHDDRIGMERVQDCDSDEPSSGCSISSYSSGYNTFRKIAMAIITIFLLWFTAVPVSREGTVESFSWERSIAIERQVVKSDSGWSLPKNAELTSSAEEIRSYTTNTVNGVETKTPVYATKYYYNVYTWEKSYDVTSSNTNQSPYWLDVPALNDNERVGDRSEVYYVTVQVGSSHIKYAISYSDWQQLNQDQHITFRTFRLGRKIFNGSIVSYG